jgi:methionyl-tRNA synthetase
VWFDAVIGYYSGSVEWSARMGASNTWKNWWQNPSARSYYFIGKDNVPFHTVIWPAELMGFNGDLNLPYDVPANQFLNIDGEKLSTSRGMAVWLSDMLTNFDPDSIRYYLASIFPETKDSNFTWEEFVAKNNGELLAAWGNLVNRVIGFLCSRFEGIVPQPLALDARDEQLIASMEKGVQDVGQLLERVNLREGLRETMRLVREVNKYLDDKAPWTLIKQDVALAGTAMYVALRAIDNLKLMLAPYLPFSSAQVHAALGYSEPLFGDIAIESDNQEGYDYLTYQPLLAEADCRNRWVVSQLSPGTQVIRIPPLFKGLDLEAILGS